MMHKTRAASDPAFQWKLSDIFETNELWEEEFQKAQKEIELLASYQGKLAESPDMLYEALKAQSAASYSAERLFVYAHMRRDEDNGNTLYQGLTDRAMQLIVSAESQTAYLVPEILTIPSETLKGWAAEERFAPFRFMLSDVDRQREHVLSAGEERILAMAEDPLGGPDNIFTMLSDVDLDFGTVTNEKGEQIKLTHGTYGTLLDCPDRRVRKEAYEKLYAAYASVKNTVCATYASSVKGDVFRARARGYKGVLEASLFGNNVPVAVYEQLIETVHEKLPAMRRYMALRKKQLGVDQLEMYDLYTPIVPDCAMPMS